MTIRNLTVRVGLGALLCALSTVAAHGQAVNQIRPRVLVMIDTSGSMSEHFTDNTTTGGDGSTFFQDSALTRQFPNDKNLSLYVGREVGGANQCVTPPTTLASYDGINSRLFAAKQALTNIVNASGDIDWGLMRYTGDQCPIQSNTFTPDPTFANGLPTNKKCANAGQCNSGRCGFNSGGVTYNGLCRCGTNLDCATGTCNTGTRLCEGGCTVDANCTVKGTCNVATGKCVCGNSIDCPPLADVCQAGVCGTNPAFTPTGAACTTDNDCATGEFCVNSACGTDNNLCNTSDYGANDTRGGNNGCTYQNGDVPLAYGGSCGTGANQGDPLCATPMVCYQDFDCNGANGTSQCGLMPNSAANGCRCGAGNGGFACPTNYTCANAGTWNGYCVYNEACQSVGGFVLVNPATQLSSAVLPYADGIEVVATDATANPELRAVGATPLAGAARTATAWYNTTIAGDSATVKTCRPYVLVQITDGFDTCDDDGTNGPVAGASDFVASTIPGAQVLNKVYVVGLAFGTNPSPTLNAIATAGGTGQARLANSQQEIQSALADIIASSVLVEKCNGKDDNCNQLCDENFPGVQVNATGTDGKTCLNPHSAASCDNGWQAGTHCAFSGHDVCSTDQLSQTCSAVTCAATVVGTLSSPAANVMRITGVNNVPATAIGQLLYVNGSAQATDNGVFKILAVDTVNNTVDVTNNAFVADPVTKIAWGYTSLQGVPTTIAIPANGTERLTVPKGTLDPTVGANFGVNAPTAGPPPTPGDTVYVVGAAPALLNGPHVVKAVTSTGAGPYIIDLTNAAATTGTAITNVGQWIDPNYCPNVEICNGIDDDCNGIIDDCNGKGSGSCCQKSCPLCAKPPFVETCNNCDDDCDGTIDNNLVDVGASCGTNVGDCAPGQVVCCSNANPTVASCTRNGTSDVLSCAGGNPGYPVTGYDLCDGTDDNCNGVPNDTPPQQCFTSPTGGALTGSPTCNNLPPAQCGCHYGTQLCVQPAPNVATAGGVCPGPISWPPGKACPNTNPATQWGACNGAQGGSPEICNGIDDDCDGIIDNNLTDTWVNPADPSHQCCTPGGNCNNTGGSMACAFGGYVCQGGVKTCVGAIPQTPEICDMKDNDCNGIVDDVPGLGNPCTGVGIITGGTCQAVLQCVAGMTVPQCVQTVGPVPEMCNGLDDDCDNVIDNPGPMGPFAPSPGQPVVGSACDSPMPPADKPPCKPGVNECIAGMVVCVGAVGPMPNQCNGISTDCTGTMNTNGNCPTGFQCFQGNCVQPCSDGEFPCPGGYACNKSTNQCDQPNLGHTGCCVPDACAKVNCPTGDICMLDPQGNGQCIDPCVNIDCGAGYICKGGACEDASCRTQGCPTGQICTGTPPVCAPDPCASVTCTGNTYCDNGTCVNACSGPCPTGENCANGKCVPDPCAKVNCLEGQVCTVSGGTGICVSNECQAGCNGGQVCCGGSCVGDPCINVHCPEDTHCTVLASCSATCNTNPAPSRDQVVGAGGGGFGCAVGGEADPSPSLALLLAGALLLLWRRRRLGAEEVR